MRSLLIIFLTASFTYMVLRWDAFSHFLIASLPYLVSSLALFLVLAIAAWFFRRQIINVLAQRSGGRVQDIYDVMVDKNQSSLNKLSVFGREYLRREQMRLMLFLCLGIAGTLVGVVNIYLMFDQNKLMREQTQQLIVQNKDIKTQTQELLAQNKMNREQWEGERRASLLKVIYDTVCESESGKPVAGQKNDALPNDEAKDDEEGINKSKEICVPNSNLRERQDAIRAYAHLQKRSSQRVNLSGANAPGTNLGGYSLSNADLSKTNLADADLSSADLDSANLTNSNLGDVNLMGANIELADLSGAYRLKEEEGKEPVKIPLDCERIKQASNWRFALGVSHCSR